MSYTKIVTLWCDSEDCLANYEYDRSSAMEARDYAAKEGWTYQSGEDYCPECSE